MAITSRRSVRRSRRPGLATRGKSRDCHRTRPAGRGAAKAAALHPGRTPRPVRFQGPPHESGAGMARKQAGGPGADLMRRGEIWVVGLDPAEGHEQKGRRPVLIVSPDAFNQVTKVPVVLPITSGGNFARTAGFAVSLTGAGTKTTGVIRCDQPRALDLGARNGRKLENVPDKIVSEVLARVATILE